MSDDEVKIKLPKSVKARAVKAIAAEVANKHTTKALQRHMHDGATVAEIGFLKAEVAYLTDPQMRPPDFFFPLLAGAMDFTVYLQKVTAERWEANREKIRAQAKAELVRRVSSQIVREQIKEAEQVSQIRGWLFDLLTPEVDKDTGQAIFKVAPRSLEGCVKVFKEVSILLQMYRQTVLQQIEPHAPQVVDEDQVSRGPFTDEEAGQIAEQLLKRRFAIEDE